jgi:hypothetical protein
MSRFAAPSEDASGFAPVYAVYAIAGALSAYTVWSSYGQLTLYQLIFLVISLLFSITAYVLIGRERHKNGITADLAVFAGYCAVTAAVFYPTAGNIFRSDDWHLLALFDSVKGFSYESFVKISFFEMFGHVRFQPLAHLLIYARHLLFGGNVVFYHLLNMALHALTAFLVYKAAVLLTEDRRLSFLLGLVFITLPSQFDTVNWTYHIYIIAGALLALLAVILAVKSVKATARAMFVAAVIMSLASFILYESAAFAPAAVFLVAWSFNPGGARPVGRRTAVFAVTAVVAAYFFYALIAAYGVSLTKAKQAMSLSELFMAVNLWTSVKTFFMNLWESTFLKNAGVGLSVNVGDIVYAELPKAWFKDLPALLKASAGVFALLLFRPAKGKTGVALVLGALALSYLFIITTGRSLTNSPSYFIAQPRYQYFANAVLLVMASLFLCASHKGRRLGPALATVFIAVSFWNTQTVMAANNKVAEAMGPMDAYYYKVKGFLKENPRAVLFLDFTPDVSTKFFLGTDAALDLIYKGSITKFQARASHVYDGETVRAFSAPSGASAAALGNFTVVWNYTYNTSNILDRDVTVAGSRSAVYPRLFVTPVAGGQVVAELVNASSGATEAYRFAYRPLAEASGPGNFWKMDALVVEKDGDMLCFAQNSKLVEKARLTPGATYKNWNSDGFGLFGDYYRGAGVAVYVSGLYILADGAAYSCKDAPIGSALALKTNG